MRDLAEMIDEVMSGREWHSIRIFNGAGTNNPGWFVSMGRDYTTFVVDQLSREERPSVKLRAMLEQALGEKPVGPLPAAPTDDFDDVLG